MACLGHLPSLAGSSRRDYTEAVISLPMRLFRLPAGAGLILILAGAAAPAFHGWAENGADTNRVWFTRVWQTDDGLPNNQVTAIAQGQDGYLWVGTAVGLARFDGLHFTRFPYLIPASGPGGGVSQLLPARGGGLWIRTRRGSVIHLSADLATVALAGTGLPTDRAQDLIEDPQGCLWIAYPESVWRVKDGRAEQIAGFRDMPAHGYVSGFAIDRDGHLWVAKGNSVYLYHPPSPGVGATNQERFELITHTVYRAHLAASQAGGVWVAAGKRLLKCDRHGEVRDYGSFSTVNIHAGTTVVMEDHAGAVWIGSSSGGLFRRGKSGFDKVETSHPDILSLAEDREGNLWVGTAGGGLDRVNTRGVELEGLNAGASRVAVQSVCEDARGVLWGATQNGLLVFRVDGQWRPALTNAPWTNAVDCVAADRTGAVWIGTRNSGLFCWRDGRFENWDAARGLVSHVISEMLPVSSGDLWIVEQAPVALQCLRAGRLLTLRVPRKIGRITALAQDAANRVWVGTDLGALLRVEGDRLAKQTIGGRREAADAGATSPDTDSLSSDAVGGSILCLYPTPDGALWIGYGGGGLGCLRNGRFARMNAEQGLADNYISQMLTDDKGWFWFGGERGIFKARIDDLESVLNGRAERVRSITYGRNEGLFSVEADSANANPYVSPRAIRSCDGRLWFPLRKTLAVVNPKSLRVPQEPPPALVTRVTVDGKIIAAYGGVTVARTVANLRAPGQALRLPPAHRHLTFDFTAINLSAPENVRFRYQLAGFDDGWMDAATERSASYSRLAPGHYEFRVEAAMGDGPWSRTPAALAFAVAPFFWQTWWFRLGVILLFTASVIAAVRYISFRRLQAEMRLIAQRAALDKERTRIARDLHDDLGCSLNKAALTLDMTQRRLAAGAALNGEIEHCSTLVRQAAQSVDEIVWAINPRNDTLRYMVDYISQFAVEFLHAADIPCRVDLPDDVPDRHLSPEARHNLFLVVKEALNNVARHACAREVRLRVTASADQVAIVIEDNGRGFERAPDSAACDGLRNMRQRMEEIGGQFELESRPGTGTRVAFHYAWPQIQPACEGARER